MNGADAILSVSWLSILFVSWILASCKSGIAYYSPQSLFSKDQRKFQIDQTKINSFVIILVIIMGVSMLFALAVTQGNFSASMLYAGSNVLAASYGLAYLVLLKEKK